MQTTSASQQPAQPAPTPPPGMSQSDFARFNRQLNEQLTQQLQGQVQAGVDAAERATQGGSFRALVVGSGPGGVPMNESEMRALRMQREEMSNQLTNVADRRESLVDELGEARGEVARQGLEARIGVLDKRILDIEREMARTGELVMMAPASLQRVTARSGGGGGGGTSVARGPGSDWTPSDATVTSVSIVFTLAVLMPLAITAARIMWRRATGALPARQAKAETDRFDRLEQAVDSIAIEMERVSEGQRFVTRILTEGRGESPVFGAANRGEALRVPAVGAQGGDPERR